ncbi:MAG: membrane protein insertion efficiency factor YidD, partial [Cyclobacteriaceae bacterium]|nr:membrane protein insertion efficiency factor YidD [Cyclobacteriaceae bacterium]
MKKIILAFFISINVSLHAQSIYSDLALLKGADWVQHAPKKKKNNFNLNPIYLIYQGSMGLYQKHISAQIGANCIYEITCSQFSRQLVKEFGVTKGFFLSLDRVGRC